MWVWFLGGENPLEEEMATYSSTLAWEIPGREEPGGLWSMGSQKSQTGLKWLSTRIHTHTHTHTHTHLIAVTTLSLSVGLSDGSHDQMQVVCVWQEYPGSNVSSSAPPIRRPTKTICPHSQCVYLDGLVKKLFTRVLSKAFVIAKSSVGTYFKITSPLQTSTQSF